MDRTVAERVVGECLDDPDSHVLVLSAGTGWMRVEIFSGDAPLTGSLLYVNGRGLFEVTRVDEWHGDGAQPPRLLAMLGSLPDYADADAPTYS